MTEYGIRSKENKYLIFLQEERVEVKIFREVRIVGVLWYNAGSTRCLDNMISFLMHIPYIIENFVKIYKPSCMHPHRYYHSAEVCKSLIMLFILFLTYVFSLYY